MKTVSHPAKKLLRLSFVLAFVFSACSTVKEQGEPETTAPPNVITNDVQREAVYERGAENISPQNANPIPTADQLKLDEKASEINRKTNIEEHGDPNAPANTPTEQRPRELRDVGNDTVFR